MKIEKKLLVDPKQTVWHQLVSQEYVFLKDSHLETFYDILILF